MGRDAPYQAGRGLQPLYANLRKNDGWTGYLTRPHV